MQYMFYNASSFSQTLWDLASNVETIAMFWGSGSTSAVLNYESVSALQTAVGAWCSD